MIYLSKAKFILPKFLHNGKGLQTQIYLEYISYFKNGKHSPLTKQQKGLRTTFHASKFLRTLLRALFIFIDLYYIRKFKAQIFYNKNIQAHIN